MTLATTARFICIVSALVLGCVTDATDEHWGESYHELTQRQIANPEAGSDRQTTHGLSSTSADHVSDAFAERRSTAKQSERMESSTLEKIRD